MGYVALDNGETSELSREDFTVVGNEENGHVTLVIPRIAVSLSSEYWADMVIADLLGSLDFYERQE